MNVIDAGTILSLETAMSSAPEIECSKGGGGTVIKKGAYEDLFPLYFLTSILCPWSKKKQACTGHGWRGYLAVDGIGLVLGGHV